MIQFDNDLIDLDSFAYPNYLWFVRVLIFVATPVMPVFVILRALRLSSEKRKLEAEWKKNQESICKTYLRYNKLNRKKRKVMTALADMKMVDVSTEAVPQLYILIALVSKSLGFSPHNPVSLFLRAFLSLTLPRKKISLGVQIDHISLPPFIKHVL